MYVIKGGEGCAGKAVLRSKGKLPIPPELRNRYKPMSSLFFPKLKKGGGGVYRKEGGKKAIVLGEDVFLVSLVV